MKAAIVTFGLLRKHRRWDACFYLDPGKRERDELARSEKQLARQQQIVRNKQAALLREQRTLRYRFEQGDIKPIAGIAI